jgi:hypothetical protein
MAHLKIFPRWNECTFLYSSMNDLYLFRNSYFLRNFHSCAWLKLVLWYSTLFSIDIFTEIKSEVWTLNHLLASRQYNFCTYTWLYVCYNGGTSNYDIPLYFRSLRDNKIDYIEPGTFAPMGKLDSLEVLGKVI